MAVRSPPVVCVGLNQVKPWFASESPANRKSSELHPRSTRAGARAEIGLCAINVISRERGSFNAFEKLNLKNHESIVPERGLESGKVEFPHPNEALGGPEPLFQMRSCFE